MKTTDAITQIYQIYAQEDGPIAARQTVTAIITNVIFDIQERGDAVTAEALEQGLEDVLKLMAGCSDSNVA